MIEPVARIARSGSDGETLATFRAAPCEDLTTRSRGHAGAKTVGALTMQIARLVSTLHAGSRQEICAKTSTCWGGKKGGKGTQRPPQCQARRDRRSRVGSQKDRASGLWITLGATV